MTADAGGERQRKRRSPVKRLLRMFGRNGSSASKLEADAKAAPDQVDQLRARE